MPGTSFGDDSVSVSGRPMPTGPLSIQSFTETTKGYLYVAGRLAGLLERWHIVWNRCTFDVVPSSVDAFLAGYGGLSHMALVWKGTTYVFRVESGHLKDGTALIQIPSALELPSPDCPGLRLPTT